MFYREEQRDRHVPYETKGATISNSSLKRENGLTRVTDFIKESEVFNKRSFQGVKMETPTRMNLARLNVCQLFLHPIPRQAIKIEYESVYLPLKGNVHFFIHHRYFSFSLRQRNYLSPNNRLDRFFLFSQANLRAIDSRIYESLIFFSPAYISPSQKCVEKNSYARTLTEHCFHDFREILENRKTC